MRRLLLCVLFTVIVTAAHAQSPVPAYTGTAFHPYGMAEYNGKMYINAETIASGYEIWSFNGTGTPSMIADLYPGTGDGTYRPGNGVQQMAVYMGKLYFGGNNSVSGDEPFVYDLVNPPALLADLKPGIFGSAP